MVNVITAHNEGANEVTEMGVLDRVTSLLESEEEESGYECTTCGEQFEVIHMACPSCGGDVEPIAEREE